ncbi:MAG TPA: hypothetical protein VJ770_01290 [Stellaceae bacterium]|nr:hypothetical protein [Stellaceae bacterium]
MNSMLSASAALVVAGLLASPAAFAQTPMAPMAPPAATAPATSTPRTGSSSAMTSGRETAEVPQGPYLNRCKDARILGGALVAFCNTGNGTWHTALLPQNERAQCTGPIEDINGFLKCPRGPLLGSSTPPQAYGSAYGQTYGANPPVRTR